MSAQTSMTFAVAKKNRVPLAEIDVRGTDTAKKISRVLPSENARAQRTATFNSAL
ncbi:FxSxx-COOH cyclophane-containing RiPP peptide [Streptomyces sp. TRM49041]|uniref:FxSxx-COOH cyclophane-containing RiPP peptide n=1 Tax=Streptomyces sp. TRM49041 TaxID=2603216 RepID=UPI0021CCACCD|nr:FxSxx-COOH cyclophane-containing RiPP peptide [Streptomyces sp. TRM49041]